MQEKVIADERMCMHLGKRQKELRERREREGK
jgi:hypothetical protein